MWALIVVALIVGAVGACGLIRRGSSAEATTTPADSDPS